MVLASLSVPGMERNIAMLDRLGIPMLVLAPTSLADIRADIARVGQVLQLENEASAVVAEMEMREYAFSVRRDRPVRVYLEWWPKPMFSPGATCWSNELIALAGGENVFRHMPGQSNEITTQQVVEADPEVILISWCGVPYEKLDPENVLKRDGIDGVSAIQKRRVYPIDESLLGRPGPRVLDGVARMEEAMSGLRRTV